MTKTNFDYLAENLDVLRIMLEGKCYECQFDSQCEDEDECLCTQAEWLDTEYEAKDGSSLASIDEGYEVLLDLIFGGKEHK